MRKVTLNARYGEDSLGLFRCRQRPMLNQHSNSSKPVGTAWHEQDEHKDKGDK